MTPELRWLRSFLTVVEEQHFSRAARKLNLAQPALTAHIQQLEESVGAKLFERTNRLTGLTPAGRALLPEAEAIVERTDALIRKVGQVARGESGLLRLGLIPPAATTAVAEALRRLARGLPGIEVHVRQGNQDRLENQLLDSDLDLMLGREPHRSSAGVLSHRLLFVEQQGIVLRSDDPLAALEKIPLRDMDGLRVVLLRGNPHFGQNLLELAAKNGVQLTPLHAADDFPSLHWMVRAGFGVAPCSLLLSDALPGGLVARPVRPTLPELEIRALWRGRVPPPPAARWLQIAGRGFA